MAFDITFSKEYVDVLGTINSVISKIKDRNRFMIFKNNDRYYVSIMDLNVLVSVSTDSRHVSFQEAEIGVTNIKDFMKYVEAINYPEDGSSISCETGVTIKGKQFEYFKFCDAHSEYRMSTASPSLFDPNDDKKVPVERATDPCNLHGNFLMTVADIKQINKDISTICGPTGTCFGMSVVNNKIKMYLRGMQRQQLTRTIDSMNTRILGDWTTASDKKQDQFKLFPIRLYQYMAMFGCDFDIEIRTLDLGANVLVILKGYGELIAEDGSKISILVGTQESSAETATNNFDIIE